MKIGALSVAHLVITLLVGGVFGIFFSIIFGVMLGLSGFTESIGDSAAFDYAIIFLNFVGQMAAAAISAILLRRFIASGQGEWFVRLSAISFLIAKSHAWMTYDPMSLFGVIMTVVPSLAFTYLTYRLVRP